MQNQVSTNWRQLSVIVMVFFFWGFVAASNDILIPVFKEKLRLEQWQSQMISFAFYIAYTVGSLIYYGISKWRGEDVLNRLGYRNGIVLGLLISALGTLLFYPAAETASFNLMITGLFVVGLGFSLQQTAANPLAISMGDPRTGAQRLSMAGGVNNFGTTIGPLIVSYAILGTVTTDGASMIGSIAAVKTPYLWLGAAFVLVALVFRFSSVPNRLALPESSPADLGDVGHVDDSRRNAFSFPQLTLGMIAIFLYVGVEVSTASNLPEFMKQHLTVDGKPFPTPMIAPYIALYWASLMIGRWTGSVGAFGLRGTALQLARLIMPYVAFGVFLSVTRIARHDVTPFYVYGFVILAMIAGDAFSKGNPARQLLIFSMLGITALGIGIAAEGMISVYAFISVGLFCSTLWPSIFTLAIAGLGRHTNEGSSLLIMMIMGGGVISVLQGLLASPALLGIQWSYLVGILCFLYLAFYAVRAGRILGAQGIRYDTPVGGH